MSLINEALKRTRDASANASIPAPVGASYRVQGDVVVRRTKNSVLATVLIAVAVLAFVVAVGWSVAKRVQMVKDGFVSNAAIPLSKSTVTEIKPPSPATEEAVKVDATSPVAPVPVPVAPTADSKVNEDQIVTKVMERIKVEQAADPKPAVAELPKLVLQGITYAKDGSEAMINNQTVHEGDEIEGAHVVAIENRRVKLDFNGHEISLRLP